jgi:hypothetical protein
MGGYTYLHRDVQMATTRGLHLADLQMYDAFVTSADTVMPAPLERAWCNDEACVWHRRDGDCTVSEADLRHGTH